MLPEECNNSGPLSSDLFGKCSDLATHISFPFYLIPRSPSIFIFSSFVCPAAIHLHLHLPDLATFFLFVFSDHRESQLLLYAPSSFLWLFWISLSSSHPLAHSGHLVLFISCCLIAPFTILQCICPNLNYSIRTASLISVLPGHH